ncbi:hypothetical protein Ctha_1640 [Chloroherpeton thalassium ATCC 35110]|uniref:Uncharacterized protein n=1 Tax=Chloroherpeton thalassium (strain ATCC 35110 / GB-78) TaxID=517418 RepID=B3QSQ1_CHLT3|nr:hypothetical protein [Chloroherpeton thalassium]ACF14098.1 hypothetical protein Ctha_1640 [Chloroherpeton thalassium ATCC 35110]
MKAYKFITKVSDTGTIQIPSRELFDKEVEIIILPKPEPEKKKMTAMEFVQKWAGFLSNSNIDKAKLDYLSEKYCVI